MSRSQIVKLEKVHQMDKLSSLNGKKGINSYGLFDTIHLVF